jgi:chemotaxis protein methyltransferase CheR
MCACLARPELAGAAPGSEATSLADAALVEATLEQLARLIGLAPTDVARRRLARQPALLARAADSRPEMDDPAWAEVVDVVTVQETRLFRNPAQLALFHHEALPVLIQAARARGSTKLRLLSAGCATGEEAWTLAALAREAIAESGGSLSFEVVGLDLSRPALRTAATGRYPPGPPDPLRDVPARFRPLFAAADGGVEVADSLRGAVRFARANLLELAGDHSGFDAIACRNVGIYLLDAARARIARQLAALLRPSGAMLLGPTDVVPADAGLWPWSPGMVSVLRRPAAPAPESRGGAA